MPSSEAGRLRELFDALVELPADERAARLDDAALSPALRQRLLAMLAESAQGFLSETDLQRLGAGLQQMLPGAIHRGQRVGAYEIIAALGDGGMGQVFLARRADDAVEHEVAIKIVRRDRLSPALVSRFSAERRTLARLDHPGICRFLDAGELPDGTAYVVLERVEGLPLLLHCDREALALPARLALFRKVCAAVMHAHQRLVVHRDLKSENVLVDTGGQPKLLDFGIAKSIAPASALTTTGQRFLTPANAAPEQLGGEPVGVGCDVYQLGVLLYELVCGLPPFELSGLSAGEIERRILQVPPPSPSERALQATAAQLAARGLQRSGELRRALRGDLDAIINRCLRKEPEQRYRSVEQLDADLSRVLQSRPITLRAGDRGYRLRKFIARNRVVSALVAALLASLLGGLAVTLQQAYTLAEQRNRAVVERDRAQQVVALLEAAFLGADPARVAGADIGLRHVLGSAQPRLAGLQETQPALHASLVATLADVQLALGEHAAAARLTRSVLDHARPADVDHALWRRLWLIDGRAHSETGEFERAFRALGHARPPEAQAEPAWQVAFGRALTLQRRIDEALPLLRAAVDATAARVAEDEVAVDARWQLAAALELAGDAPAAVQEMDRLVARLAGETSAGHPRLLLTRLQRMLSLRAADRLDEALAEGRAVLQQVVLSYGEGSTMAALAHGRLGTAHYDVGDQAAAISAFRASLHGFSATIGEHHPRTLRVAFNLAQTLAKRDESPDEAARLFRQAIAGADLRLGAASNQALFFRVGYAAFRLQRHERQAAIAILAGDAALAGIPAALPATRTRALETLQQAYTGEGCAGTPAAEHCQRAGRGLAAFAASLRAPPTDPKDVR